MKILDTLRHKWKNSKEPFIITEKGSYDFKDLEKISLNFLDKVKPGNVVALIGDFDPISIISFVKLLDIGAIVAPLTDGNKNEHNNYFDILNVDLVIKDGIILKHFIRKKHNEILESLKLNKESGIIFLSSGSTGAPKAIIHNTSLLLKRFSTPRKPYRTLNFLMFDHMGGINTLLHTIFNGGTIIGCKERSVEKILNISSKFNIEVLPATPTFLRMLLISGMVPKSIPSSIKIITYGTELMDQATLNQLCSLLPKVDFRQTYGLSEFCVLRVKSKSRDSLFMKIGGEGIETKIVDKILFIKSKYAMMGYINSPNPFDKNGWYNTKDIVEEENGYIKIIGRNSDLINVGGLKFMSSEVSNVALRNKEINQIVVYAKSNNITGQHVEVIIELKKDSSASKNELMKFFNSSLPSHMAPKKIIFDKISLNHRLKKNLNRS